MGDFVWANTRICGITHQYWRQLLQARVCQVQLLSGAIKLLTSLGLLMMEGLSVLVVTVITRLILEPTVN